MDWSNVQNIANAFGGILVLVYACWMIFNNVLSNFNIMTKKRKEKQDQQKKLEDEKYQKYIEDTSDLVLSKFTDSISGIETKLDNLTASSNDLLRIRINDIYYRYNHYKKILRYDKENCAKLITDYETQGGNSYVHDLWAEICSWEVVSTWEEVISTQK